MKGIVGNTVATTKEPLASFLRQVLAWNWIEFLEAEHDSSYSSNQATIFALIRACYAQDLRAVRTALNRADGKLKTPVRVEYPKIFTIYPFAQRLEGQPDTNSSENILPQSKPLMEMTEMTTVAGEVIEPERPKSTAPADLLTLSLRDTLRHMAELPRSLPKSIRDKAMKIEKDGRKEVYTVEPPMVKSVIVASLLLLAHGINLDAIGEVLDTVDGKLVETIQLLGEPMQIVSYSDVAPAGAVLNADGVYEIEASQAQDYWAAKMAKQTIIPGDER